MAIVFNSLEMYRMAKGVGRAYCCQQGVDMELFSPATPSETFTACWVGNGIPSAKNVEYYSGSGGATPLIWIRHRKGFDLLVRIQGGNAQSGTRGAGLRLASHFHACGKTCRRFW
ncbi:MAG: hypothetical protein LBS77_00755 [Desulfovibrio sp.]|nr:hypothetical protein [Desulfovibrio sp.]